MKYDKPFIKIKNIHRKPRTIKYKGHEIVIKYKRKKIKIYKCKQCEFKQLNRDNNGKYLKAHLTKIHKIHFIKGHSQQVKIQNTIIILNLFEEIESKEIFWICPFCKKSFIHTPTYGKNYDSERIQIIMHLGSCPIYSKKLKK